MSLPKTIDEVIIRLESILQEQRSSNKYSCLFTYIYLFTTKAVKEGIVAARFTDNERMEDFDVRFANLYIQAYQNRSKNLPISKSWALAFDAENKKMTIIQHILLGMNAHINLDLGIAAAETCPGEAIYELKDDFQTINTILFELTKKVQNKLGRVSPLFFLIDNFIKKADEEIVNFSIKEARNQSWRNAVLLAQTKHEVLDVLIEEIDDVVLKVGQRIAKPKSFFFRRTLGLIASLESQNLHNVVDRLFES